MFDRNSVVECVAAHAAANPDKLCLADAKKALTYGQVWNAVRGFASCLRKDIDAGQYVVIGCNQSVDYLVAMLGCHLAGIVAVPVERNAADSRTIELCSQTEAVLYLADKPAECVAHIPYMDIATVCDHEPAEEFPFPASEDVAEILFSTGTTGKCKGIVITQRNNMAIAENVVCGVKMKADNVELIPMPTSHSHGLRRTYANLVNGSSVVYCDGVLVIKRMLNLMDEYHVTSMDLAPSMLNIIFKLSKDRLGDYADVLDYVQLGSAPMAEEDKQHLARILPKTRLYNFYGSTEVGCSCLLDFGSMDKPHCIGKPAVNAKFFVVDEQRNVIQSSPDNMGLLVSGGDITMKEYFKAPELTAGAMEGQYLYTNDLGYIDEDGLVYMLGRVDDVINFGGVKISPEEIENAVNKCPMIKDCALIPLKDAVSGQIPKLFVSIEDGYEYNLKELKAFLAKNVDASMQPQKFEVLEEIPRTYNGKIKRKELMNR